MKSSNISTALINWYQANKRNLPWRETQDPYRIWLSEIILQQTRVNQGMRYYLDFVQHFPDIFSLADAEESEVLKHWQGLGYYSRARNMHQTAQNIVQQYKGRFPTRHEELLALKGIGTYTASAIASFAYNLPFAVVDGNVYRVLSRLYNIGIPINGKEAPGLFRDLAQELLDKQQPGLHNQALMELGAICCTHRNPNCPECPLKEKCLSLAAGNMLQRPVKEKKNAQKKRFFHYLFIHDKQGRFLLRKRMQKDIWQHLWEFPLIESDQKISKEALMQEASHLSVFEGASFWEMPHSFKHTLSHQIIMAVFYPIEVERFPKIFSEEYHCIDMNALGNYAIPRLIELFFESYSDTASVIK